MFDKNKKIGFPFGSPYSQKAILRSSPRWICCVFGLFPCIFNFFLSCCHSHLLLPDEFTFTACKQGWTTPGGRIPIGVIIAPMQGRISPARPEPVEGSCAHFAGRLTFEDVINWGFVIPEPYYKSFGFLWILPVLRFTQCFYTG